MYVYMYICALLYVHMYLGKYLMHLIAVFNLSQSFVTHQSKLCSCAKYRAK